jgi:para-aminobenzoate synthetase component I
LSDTSFPVTAVWRQDARWYHAHRPARRLICHSAAELRALPDTLAACKDANQLAVGIISYEAGNALMDVPILPDRPAIPVPLAQIYLYARCDVRPGLPPRQQDDARFSLRSPLQSDMSADDYRRALARIHAYLLAGDCYQVNFARRFSACFDGDPLHAWLALTAHHEAPHGCFFRDEHGNSVFGVSPERFLRIDQRHVVTEPIKGSRPRGSSFEEDQQLARSLQNSDKDRAENLMIVDLLRNDLGQVCLSGSVRATPLFELRQFSNVQHLVSTVRGELRPDISALQALLTCFPGGSITGAPKKRAMEIIAELEPVSRGFYCGSQFSLDDQGNLESNILIRTFQTDQNSIHCHGGGGIVVDSDADQEFAESLFKIEKLMQALPLEEQR